MRLLIGTTEICGWVSLFKTELIKSGHECYSVINERNRFNYPDNYDLVVSDYLINKKFKINFFNKILFRYNRLIQRIIAYRTVRWAKSNVDLVIFFWRSFYADSSDVKIFHEAGIKIVFYFVGSDVRDLRTFIDEFGITEWTFPDFYFSDDRGQKLKYIQEAEKYAAAIFSVPDQAGLQRRPYYHLQIPIDLSKFVFIERDSVIPDVIHIPSDPWKKGTDIIEKTLYELKEEGIRFDYRVLHNISNEEVLIELMKADILVDEIVFHGPGVLSFEAMACGCIVATKYLEESPACFKPPVWNIDAKNIKEKLRVLLTDQNLRRSLSEKSRQYVIENNRAELILNKVLSLSKNNIPVDYFP